MQCLSFICRHIHEVHLIIHFVCYLWFPQSQFSSSPISSVKATPRRPAHHIPYQASPLCGAMESPSMSPIREITHHTGEISSVSSLISIIPVVMSFDLFSMSWFRHNMHFYRPQPLMSQECYIVSSSICCRSQYVTSGDPACCQGSGSCWNFCYAYMKCWNAGYRAMMASNLRNSNLDPSEIIVFNPNCTGLFCVS